MIEFRWRKTDDPRERIEDVARNLRTAAAVYPKVTMVLEPTYALTMASMLEGCVKIQDLEAELRRRHAEIEAAGAQALANVELAQVTRVEAEAALGRAMRVQLQALAWLALGFLVWLGALLWL